MADIGTATIQVVLRSHTPSGVKAHDRGGLTVDWRSTPAGRIAGYSVDCSCDWRGVMWSNPEGAVNEYLDHVRSVVLEAVRPLAPELNDQYLAGLG